MARRPHILTVTCTFPGCTESGRYEYDTLKEYRKSTIDPRTWRCVKHVQPEALLTPTNLVRTARLVAAPSSRYPTAPGLYWSTGSGFAHGPGFKADANDFPKGTVLEVTARIILPEGIEP